MPRSLAPASLSRWNRDYGRSVARVFCVLFAVIGFLPLLGGYLVRTRPVLDWAASETARLLSEQLGVTAEYRVEMQLWPLELSLHDVRIPSTDGGEPALQVARIAVTPRVFSLLAGRLDAGDIEIDEPRSRLVIRDGEITNVAYSLPETPEGGTLERAPFATIAVSDGRIDLDVDGIEVDVSAIDVDVFAERGPSFEIAVKAGASTVTREREVGVELASDGPKSDDDPPAATKIEVDEDLLCRVEARIRIEPETILVRRLSALGSADASPKRDTRPGCRLKDDDHRRIAARLSQVRVTPREEAPPAFHGHVFARAPLFLINRFADALPIQGWVGVTGDVSYDGTSELPDVRGQLKGAKLKFGRYRLADRIDADLRINDDRVEFPRYEWDFANGTTVATNTVIEPFADPPTLNTEKVEGLGLDFPGFMRDLGVTPNTIVAWDYDRLLVSNFHGTLDPLRLDGTLHVDSSNFQVTEGAYHSPSRKHMIGIDRAVLDGHIAVTPDAFQWIDTRVRFGNSELTTAVSLGFSEDLVLSVAPGSRVDLSDISPLIDIPWAGIAEIEVFGAGKFGDPTLKGKLKVDDFEFGGFPFGDILSAKTVFRPLKLEIHDLKARKGKSDIAVKTGLLQFDSDADVVADASVASDNFDLRDFFDMWHFDEDPRFDALHGRGRVAARVHYSIGGKEDRCGGGNLRVDGELAMKDLDLFEEKYERGEAKFDFRWFDQDAGHLGIELDVPSATLHKGAGVILTSFEMKRGAEIRGHAVATNVPLSHIQGIGPLGKMVAARTSAVAEIYGTLDDLAADVQVQLSKMRVGGATYPQSDFAVNLRPENRPQPSIGRSRCGQPIRPEFDPTKYARDERDGKFHVTGSLFGGQVQFSDLQISRQRAKRVSGTIALRDLDLGTAAELAPVIAGAESKPEGRLSADIVLEDLPLEAPAETVGHVDLGRLVALRGGFRMELLPGPERIVLEDGKLDIPRLAFKATTPGGQQGTFDLRGAVADLGKTPVVDANLELRPTDLSAFVGVIPRAERAQGTIRGRLAVRGPADNLRYSGGLELEDGRLEVRGLNSALTDIDIGIVVDGEEIRITRAEADVGGGSVRIAGSVPLGDYELGQGRATIAVRGVSLPILEGMTTKVDGDFVATLPRTGETTTDGRTPLPRLTGDVLVRTFEYTRPVTMSADLSSLSKRGTRTEFDAYDPEEDFVEFDITLRSARAMNVRNNLVEAKLRIDSEGLGVSGTNQRYGMTGTVNVMKGGRIRLRQHEFEIERGTVRFDDRTRVEALVDVMAETTYQRYSGGDASGSSGRWEINMHAHGSADNLQVDLTSNPALGEDDIFLLLTLGLTQAELDQAQATSGGQTGGSVALDALGTLSGADQAVTEAVPVIDDFRFGSSYSSRTGRTEPTVTIGKRLAERIRAQVTSGQTQVGSNLEFQLSNRVSVEASYDNQNDLSNSALGNLGADIRWRLEFD